MNQIKPIRINDVAEWRFLLVFCAAAILLLSGCGPSGPQRVTVSGQVLIDGKPLTMGVVKVMPNGARPSLGQIGTDGKFVLSAKKDLPGVTLGEHPVEIIAIEVLGPNSQRRLVPQIYENHEASKLTVNITGSTESLIINLTWAGSGKSGPYIESFGKE